MKVKHLYMYALTSMIYFSCTQDEISPVDISKTSILKQAESTQQQYFVNDEGALVFNSLESYLTLTESLIRLNKEAFKSWEQRNSFHSLRSYIDSLLNTITEQEQKVDNLSIKKDFTQKYKDYLYLDEDSLIQPVIGSQSYRNIVNKNGIFYIGCIKHQVGKHRVTITNSEERNQQIKSISYEINPVITRGKNSNEISYPTIYGYGYSGAVAKYRVSTWFRIYKNIAVGPTGQSIENIYMDIMAESALKVLYFWVNDKNKFTISNLQIHMPGLGQNHFFDENGNFTSRKDEMWYLTPSTSDNCSRSTTTFGLTNGYMGQQFDSFLQDPVCVHYQVETPYARVKYETYHPLPEMDKNACNHKKAE